MTSATPASACTTPTPRVSFQGNKDAYNRVLDILKTHILLPYDLLDALWTTPFMTVSGAKMATVGGSTLYGSLDGGDTYVHAGRSKTKVAPEYVEACKAIIIKASGGAHEGMQSHANDRPGEPVGESWGSMQHPGPSYFVQSLERQEVVQQ